MHNATASGDFLIDARAGLPPVAELARTVRRHLRLAVLSAMAVAALVGAVVFNLPRLYTAEATIYVSPLAPDPLSANGENPEALGEDEVATQAALLQGGDVAASVVQQLHIGEAPVPPSPIEQWMCSARAAFAPCAVPARPTLEARIGGFLSRLIVTPAQHSRVLSVAYADRDPIVAARAVNTLVSDFQRQQIAARANDMSRTSSWLSRRAEELRAHWLAAEAQAGKFRAEHGLAGLGSGQMDQPLIAQQIGHAASDLSAAQADLAAASARHSTIAAAGSGERAGLDQITQSPSLAALNGQLSELEVRQAQLRAQYGDRHPLVLGMERQLGAARAAIAREMSKAVRAVDSGVAERRASVATLSANLAAAQAAAGAQSASQVSLSTLENEAASARASYEAFLSRAKQLDDRTELLQPQVQFATHATQPAQPTSPKTGRMLAGAIVLGLLAGLCAALAREHFARGFANVSRVGKELSLPLLSAIPALPRTFDGEDVARFTSLNPYSSAAEAVRALAYHLEAAAATGTPPRSLVIASATGSEGKTTVAIWLAHAMAAAGQRILLIDADHRRGAVGTRLDGEERSGFAEVLTGTATIASAIQHDARGRFDYIMCGNPVARVFGARESGRLRTALEGFKTDYDLVIIDTPPLLAMTEALLYGNLADATVIVCRWNSTARAAVLSSVERLNRAGAKLSGVVLSMVDQTRLALFSDDVRSSDMRLLARYYRG